MASSIAHYETLLADHYTWMVGDTPAKVAEQMALLHRMGISEQAGQALDLGCGPGYQSFALADLGYSVVAVDTSRTLLDHLEAHRGTRPIRTVHGDLRDLPSFDLQPLNVAVCMGDTLTHLDAISDIARLFTDLAPQLTPGGRLIVSFRDMSVALTSTDRVIPVRMDADRLMTCILDYDPETVVVTDVIHQREGDTWRMLKSQYRKLRLSAAQVATMLTETGFTVVNREQTGVMVTLAAHCR